jgi:5-hydroxyisourate hydrolase
MARVSTHVLDTALGQPARSVEVRFERKENGGEWKELAFDRTDRDGRCSQLLPATESLVPGIYRLNFDIARYFSSQNLSALYPWVAITFQVRSGEEHFHIPLLLSANGYTTYRGS